ncbi:MAG: LegC family aminotransferase [Muribaculaceae bacterium]|nr:LegC family aminotransferase [Muribaculaceae bacterium]
MSLSQNDYQEIVRFIRNRYKAAQGETVMLHAPVFIGNEKKYLNECIDTTFVSSVGKFVDRFEHDIAAYTGAQAAVVCVNGTNALHMALMLSGVTAGDEVLTQAVSFVATCNAISYIGAHPVFIDVDIDTMGMSPTALQNWLQSNAELRSDGFCYNKSTNRRIKACVPMHTFGHPVAIDRIAQICREWNISLIEDAAASIGSIYNGTHTGLFGDIAAMSFNGNKTITTGGGGILLFKDKNLAARAKHLTTQAKVPHRWEFVHDEVGYNYRMPNINAALGCAQLECIDTFLDNKRATAQAYKDFFGEKFPEIRFMAEPANSRSNYWLCAVMLPDKAAQQDFLAYTNDHGVMTRPIWQLMNRLPMFSNAQHDGLPNSQYLADRIVNIPSGVIL